MSSLLSDHDCLSWQDEASVPGVFFPPQQPLIAWLTLSRTQWWTFGAPLHITSNNGSTCPQTRKPPHTGAHFVLDTQRGQCKQLHVTLGGLLLGTALTSDAGLPAGYLKVMLSETSNWREKCLPLSANMPHFSVLQICLTAIFLIFYFLRHTNST